MQMFETLAAAVQSATDSLKENAHMHATFSIVFLLYENPQRYNWDSENGIIICQMGNKENWKEKGHELEVCLCAAAYLWLTALTQSSPGETHKPDALLSTHHTIILH